MLLWQDIAITKIWNIVLFFQTHYINTDFFKVAVSDKFSLFLVLSLLKGSFKLLVQGQSFMSFCKHKQDDFKIVIK
jgi:hypothetical protein